MNEIVTVVGPSGCGKTTLPNCIDGLIPCGGGSIVFDGTQARVLREGVAMVFKNFYLLLRKTPYNNLGYGLKLAGAS